MKLPLFICVIIIGLSACNKANIEQLPKTVEGDFTGDFHYTYLSIDSGPDTSYVDTTYQNYSISVKLTDDDSIDFIRGGGYLRFKVNSDHIYSLYPITYYIRNYDTLEMDSYYTYGSAPYFHYIETVHFIGVK